MKKNVIRILALLMCLVMVVPSSLAFVYAEDGENQVANDDQSASGNNQFVVEIDEYSGGTTFTEAGRPLSLTVYVSEDYVQNLMPGTLDFRLESRERDSNGEWELVENKSVPKKKYDNSSNHYYSFKPSENMYELTAEYRIVIEGLDSRFELLPRSLFSSKSSMEMTLYAIYQDAISKAIEVDDDNDVLNAYVSSGDSYTYKLCAEFGGYIYTDYATFIIDVFESDSSDGFKGALQDIQVDSENYYKIWYTTATGLTSDKLKSSPQYWPLYDVKYAYLRYPIVNFSNEEFTWKDYDAEPPEDLSEITAIAVQVNKNGDYAKTGGPDKGSVTTVEYVMEAPQSVDEGQTINTSSAFVARYQFQELNKGNNVYRYNYVNSSEATTVTWIPSISFIKQQESDDENIPLSGAEFSLYQCSNASEDHTHVGIPGQEDSCFGIEAVKVAKSGEDGTVEFKSLDSGTYALVESGVPSGFEDPNTYWIYEVDASAGTVTEPEAVAYENAKALQMTYDESLDSYVLLNTKLDDSKKILSREDNESEEDNPGDDNSDNGDSDSDGSDSDGSDSDGSDNGDSDSDKDGSGTDDESSKSSSDKNTRTSDDANLALWLMLMLTAGAIAAIVVCRRKLN